MKVQIEAVREADWPAVAAIYAEGIATGHATFAGRAPGTWADFCDGKLMACAGVARDGARGVRLVGRRGRVGKMPDFGPRAGEWRDTLLLERRSKVSGRD